jgi:hypothetical protein
LVLDEGQRDFGKLELKMNREERKACEGFIKVFFAFLACFAV